MVKTKSGRTSIRMLVLISTIFLYGCGSGGDAWRYDPGLPLQVTGLTVESGDGLVTLSWNGDSVATSYNIYYVSGATQTDVSKTNSIKINVTTTSWVISGLNNNTPYYFMVTAQNRNGEGATSVHVSATPGPISLADISGAWYFHTLVTGTGAKWERGRIDVDSTGNAVISNFEDSNGVTQSPPGFALTINGSGEVLQSGSGRWSDFRGVMGSRKNMIVSTWTCADGVSRALTIFQKKRATDDYSEQDVSGTGSGQNPYNPYLQGNGPTRYAYHQISSGANTEWEYSNCKIGQHGQFWLEQYKDIIYWDYGTPTYKVAAKYDYLWKITSIGVDPDGLVKEYSNYATVRDGIHNVVFTGRMTADKTVIIGVSTRDDGSGGNRQYFLKIMELCFYPTDQALPVYTLNDLAGRYKFHKLSAISGSGGAVTPSWSYGVMSITNSGVTTFPEYTDSSNATTFPDTFTLAYYADNGIKLYTDFANFTSPVQNGALRYFHLGTDGYPIGDVNKNLIQESTETWYPYRTTYDYWSYGRTNQPLAIPINNAAGQSYYYNEHGSLSYNRDLLVMTRTDSSGHSIIIGLK